jgi:hypothetical protein
MGEHAATRFGGGRGIRTPGAFRHGGFQDRCVQPLRHPSTGCRKPGSYTEPRTPGNPQSPDCACQPPCAASRFTLKRTVDEPDPGAAGDPGPRLRSHKRGFSDGQGAGSGVWCRFSRTRWGSCAGALRLLARAVRLTARRVGLRRLCGCSAGACLVARKTRDVAGKGSTCQNRKRKGPLPSALKCRPRARSCERKRGRGTSTPARLASANATSVEPKL